MIERAAEVALGQVFLLAALRQVKYHRAPARIPLTLGDYILSLLQAASLVLLLPHHPVLAGLFMLLAVLVFTGLWLDALLYRIFTFELGAGGVSGVVLSNLYREVVRMSVARQFFRTHLLLALRPSWATLVPRRLGGALLWDFLFPRRPLLPAGFRPLPQHAHLLSQAPALPPPSPLHGRLRGASVVLLSFESVNETHGAHTPFLDGLRPRSVHSRCHVCLAPLTNSAHELLYASEYTPGPGPFWPAVLQQAGYQTVYLTTATVAHYGLLQILKRAGFAHVLSGGGPTDLGLLTFGLRRLRGLLDGRPFFLHVHAAGTHLPYHVGDPVRFGRHDPDSDQGRFRNAVEECDWVFSELWAALREQQDGGPPLLVLTSDHGQAFGEHGYFSHGSAVISEEINVPLLLHHPLLAPRPVAFSTHLDVLPTVLDLLGLSPGRPCLGESIFHEGHEDRSPGHLLWDGRPSRSTSNCLGLLVGDRKYSLDLVRGECLESDLHDQQARALSGDERRYVEGLIAAVAARRGVQ